MKRIILFHTVKPMYLSFESRVREALECEVRIDNMLDTCFANNLDKNVNRNRLFMAIKCAEMAQPDLIAVICSTLSPYIKEIAPFISVPLIGIDDRLGEVAFKHGDRVMVLASAQSPVEPVTSLLTSAAGRLGRLNAVVEAKLDERAFYAMIKGDMETHDNVMLELAKTVEGFDVIVMAQGSAEHLAQPIMSATGLPVVTAPELCIANIKEVIDGQGE